MTRASRQTLKQGLLATVLISAATAALATTVGTRPTPQTLVVPATPLEGRVEVTVVLRGSELLLGHRSDCSGVAGAAELSEACARTEGRWDGIERLMCRGVCDASDANRLDLVYMIEQAQDGFDAVEPVRLVVSGVVDPQVVDAFVGALAPLPVRRGDTPSWFNRM